MGYPYYPPPSDYSETLPEIPTSIHTFAVRFSRCFSELTQSRQSWWNPTAWIPRPNSAADKAIRTTLFALDSAVDYIRIRPYSQGSLQLAGILFNAVLEVAGLPSLNIDFGDETWAWYTLKAVDGNLEPLSSRVLDELVIALGRPPLD